MIAHVTKNSNSKVAKRPANKEAATVRYESLDEMPPPEPFGEELLNMSDEEVERRALEDPDAGVFPADFWDKAVVVEPVGTEQITLRLPRRVLAHFRATGKGYQSRISAVLASYVDAQNKKAG